MLANYLKIAFRNLLKHKGFSFINILGLAIGMTCCILILLYVQDERSYDRYHENADRIYRLRVERFAGGGETERSAAASSPMAPAALSDLPQIERAVRFNRRTYLVEHEDRRFYEPNFLWADSSVFDVFSFPFLRGDPKSALVAPYSVVLTASMAEKYFGSADPMGQTLLAEGRTLTVTGVMRDVPENAHFTFDFLGSFTTLEALNQSSSSTWNWWSLSYHTYFLLAEGASLEAVAEGLREMPARYIGDQESQSGYRQFLYLQPLTDIHLHSHYRSELGTNNQAAYLYIFAAIAVFILLIACINFMNLSTARSAQRAREVGMRKVAGAGKGQLVRQFLGESVLLALCALALSLVLIQALLPLFNELADKALSLNYLEHLPFIFVLFAFALLVGVAAGSYPAFVLSAFRPVEVLKGTFRGGKRGAYLRQGLVVFQFTISVVLIASAAVVFDQLSYMKTKNLGFEKEQTVVLNVRNNQGLVESYEAFKQEAATLQGVQQVTFSSSVAGRSNNTNVISRTPGMNEDGQTMYILAVDHDFIDTYGLEVIAGRGFSKDYPTDDSSAYVINESTLKALGWTAPEQAIGQELTRQFEDTRTVIGVVRDFNYASLQNAVEPLVLKIRPDWFTYASVRIDTEDVPETLAKLTAAWNTFSPGRPMESFFLDDDYDRQYRAEERISTLLNIFTVLAIFIACLGLFALASFVTEQRTKEIGVRKVMGASVGSIVVLLSSAFTRLVLIAIVVALPLAYFLMDWWLQNFAYQTSIEAWTFFLAGGLALLIAWLTVSYQSIRAAVADPVRALRYE